MITCSNVQIKRIRTWLTIALCVFLGISLPVTTSFAQTIVTEFDLTGDGTPDVLMDNGIMWLQINRDSAKTKICDGGGRSGGGLLADKVHIGGQCDQIAYWEAQSMVVEIAENTMARAVVKVVTVDTANGKQITRSVVLTLDYGAPYAWVEYDFTNTGSSAFLYDQQPSHIHNGAYLGGPWMSEKVDIDAYINGVGDIGLTSLNWWQSYAPDATEPFMVLHNTTTSDAVTFGFKAGDYSIHQAVAYYTGSSTDTMPYAVLMATPLTLEPGESAHWSGMIAFHDGGVSVGETIYQEAQAPEELDAIWCESFEDYPSGSSASPTWIGSGNVGGISVDTDDAHTGEKSMRLFGIVDGCWGALAFKSLETSFPMTIETAVKNGSEELGGCHPYHASMQLNTAPDWTANAIGLWRFANNGDFDIEIHDGDEIPSFTGYELNTWHTVKVSLDLPGDGFLHASYWVNGEFLGEFVEDAATWPFIDDLQYLAIAAQEGSVWFDDVCISSSIELEPRLVIPSVASQPCGIDECLIQPIDVIADQLLAGLTLPIWFPAEVSICSLSTQGLVTQDWYISYQEIGSNYFLVSMADQSGTVIEPGQTTVLRVYYTYATTQCQVDNVFAWDTTFMDDPFRRLTFTSGTFSTLNPSFDPSTNATTVVGFSPGDVNNSTAIDINDLVYLISYMFQYGDEPCLSRADVNGDCAVDVSDLVKLIAYIFQGGYELECPCSDPGNAVPKVTSASSTVVAVDFDGDKTTITLESDKDILALDVKVSGIGVGAPKSLLSDDIDMFHRTVDGQLRIGLFDIEGAVALASGNTEILEISGEWSLISATAVDRGMQSLFVPAKKDEPTIPSHFSLSQNYPNPFNPVTVISFSLPEASDTRLEIYNTTGQRVAVLVDAFLEAGIHSVTWDGSEVSSGVYFYRIASSEFEATRKMMLLK